MFSCIACYFGGDYVNLVTGGRRRIADLNVDNRVWTLSSDGQGLIEDEIFCIPHVGRKTILRMRARVTVKVHGDECRGRVV